MADTIQAAIEAALWAAGLDGPNPPTRPEEPAAAFLPPGREMTRDLNPTLRIELNAALTRGDLSGLVWVSDHAIKRFRERFESEISLDEARLSLTTRVCRGRWHSARPSWVSLKRGSRSAAPLENVGYIVAREGDDEIVLPLNLTAGRAEPLAVVTCLYPTPPEAGLA